MRKISFCEISNLFSRAPIRNCLWGYYRYQITSIALKNVKKTTIYFKLFWYKIFVH